MSAKRVEDYTKEELEKELRDIHIQFAEVPHTRLLQKLIGVEAGIKVISGKIIKTKAEYDEEQRELSRKFDEATANRFNPKNDAKKETNEAQNANESVNENKEGVNEDKEDGGGAGMSGGDDIDMHRNKKPITSERVTEAISLINRLENVMKMTHAASRIIQINTDPKVKVQNNEPHTLRLMLSVFESQEYKLHIGVPSNSKKEIDRMVEEVKQAQNELMCALVAYSLYFNEKNKKLADDISNFLGYRSLELRCVPANKTKLFFAEDDVYCLGIFSLLFDKNDHPFVIRKKQ